jgi:hypothetical protein
MSSPAEDEAVKQQHQNFNLLTEAIKNIHSSADEPTAVVNKLIDFMITDRARFVEGTFSNPYSNLIELQNMTILHLLVTHADLSSGERLEALKQVNSNFPERAKMIIHNKILNDGQDTVLMVAAKEG